MWRAIRYGLSGELLDFDRGEQVHARARIEQLLEWVAPVADEIGAAPFLNVPERNAAERQIARFDEGASLEEIYSEQVRTGEPAGSTIRWLTSRTTRSTSRPCRSSWRPSASSSSSSRPPRRSRAWPTPSWSGGTSREARKAIDALAALVPQLEGELADDLALALTRLQLAYADAVNRLGSRRSL